MIEFENPWVVEKQADSWIVKFTPDSLTKLGRIIFLDLPNVGAKLQKGMPCIGIEATNWTGTGKVPMTGTVSAVNQALAGLPTRKITSEDWIVQLTKE